MPRDALWVLPSGVTAVVTVDDDGNRIEDALAVAEEAPEDPAKPPEPPRQKRGRRNRH